MNKEQILELLTEQEAHLFTSVTNAKLVFGEDSEAFKVARARWSTTYELLKKIQNENN